jgi:hypothetical protein
MKKMCMTFISTSYSSGTKVIQTTQQTNYTGTHNVGNNFMNIQGIKNVNCSSCSGRL